MKFTVTLTGPELDTVRDLVVARIEDGSYHGNKAQYEARLMRIHEKLRDARLPPSGETR